MKTYDKIGQTYTIERHADSRIEERIHQKLLVSQTVLNIGSGTGSYEPLNKSVISLDPSKRMHRNRPMGAARCVQGEAEALPFRDAAFDGAMAILTVHHWSDWKSGIREAIRISKGPIVILTWDPDHEGFWLTQDYLPEIAAMDTRKFPSLKVIRDIFENVTIEPILIPWNCTDGFLGAYWRRPEAYLEDSKRMSISSLALNSSLDGLEKLRRELSNGMWEKKHGYLRKFVELDVGYKLVVIGKKQSHSEPCL